MVERGWALRWSGIGREEGGGRRVCMGSMALGAGGGGGGGRAVARWFALCGHALCALEVCGGRFERQSATRWYTVRYAVVYVMRCM